MGKVGCSPHLPAAGGLLPVGATWGSIRNGGGRRQETRAFVAVSMGRRKAGRLELAGLGNFHGLWAEGLPLGAWYPSPGG